MEDTISNLVQMLDSIASKYPSRTAIIFGSKKISYAGLQSNSKKLALSLKNLGIQQADKVALWLPNCPEFIYSFFAVLRLGAIVVPVNTMFKREEAMFIVRDSCSKILICSIDKISDSENILSRGDTMNYVISLPAPKDKVALGFYNLIRGQGEFNSKVDIKDDDIAELVYTSGTTGKPKGACLTHGNLLSNVKDCSQVINLAKRDCFICILPLFHSFASTVCMLLPIYKGARIVIMRTVKPFKRVIRAIFKHRVTVFAGVPSLYSILAETKVSRLNLLLNSFLNPVRVCISGAAALPYPVWDKFEKKFRRSLIQGYGLTEASPVVSLNPINRKRNKPESIGLPLVSVEIKIVDGNGREVSCGEVGELLVKGPNVMRGYYNLEEETKQVLQQGWLSTGDLAKVDEEGYIYIMGRLKEMINVRGLNVYPREIEDLFYKHPLVKEAAVVGVFHRHRGEVPVAFVIKQAAEVSERDLIKYLRANLAPYKVPLRIFFKDELPKNSTGKILKRNLQEEVKDIFSDKAEDEATV